MDTWSIFHKKLEKFRNICNKIVIHSYYILNRINFQIEKKGGAVAHVQQSIPFKTKGC